MTEVFLSDRAPELRAYIRHTAINIIRESRLRCAQKVSFAPGSWDLSPGLKPTYIFSKVGFG